MVKLFIWIIFFMLLRDFVFILLICKKVKKLRVNIVLSMSLLYLVEIVYLIVWISFCNICGVMGSLILGVFDNCCVFLISFLIIKNCVGFVKLLR